jgi:hypothetical protein
MRLVVALVLNAALLALVLPWLRREWRMAPQPLRRVQLPALGLRLLTGAIGGLHLTKDTYWMSELGMSLTNLLWADPGSLGHYLLGDSYRLAGWNLVHYGTASSIFITSNSFFISKLLVFINLFTLGANWLNGAYLSLFVFVGSWKLVRVMAQHFPAIPAGAGAVSLLLWPTVLAFASGVRKETLLLGSGTWLLALVLQELYSKPAGLEAGAPGPRRMAARVANGVLLVLLALLHFKVRYFFAAPLLGVLCGLAVIRLAQRTGFAMSRLAQATLLVGVLVAGLWLGAQLATVISVNKFTSQLIAIYNHHLGVSAGKPHFEYPDLQPTGESALQHAPLAIWNTLSRPWLGESRELPYILAGLDNLALLALLGLAGWSIIRRRPGNLPFALGLALTVHCLLLAFLIGLSTPNLGTMHRYRSGLLPLLLLLLLQNDYAAALLRRIGLGNGPARAQDAVSLPPSL